MRVFWLLGVGIGLVWLGYAGYYGLSLIVGSYPVLFVSIAAHAAQFGFLVFFENPRECNSYSRIILSHVL